MWFRISIYINTFGLSSTSFFNCWYAYFQSPVCLFFCQMRTRSRWLWPFFSLMMAILFVDDGHSFGWLRDPFTSTSREATTREQQVQNVLKLRCELGFIMLVFLFPACHVWDPRFISMKITHATFSTHRCTYRLETISRMMYLVEFFSVSAAFMRSMVWQAWFVLRLVIKGISIRLSLN